MKMPSTKLVLGTVLFLISAVALMWTVAADHRGAYGAAAAAGGTEGPPMGSDGVDAYVHALRADLSRGKVKLISDVMDLNADEAAKFWPIYQEYETELFDLGDKRVDLIRRFSRAQKAGNLSTDDASAIAKGYFEIETDRIALTRKYYEQISTELSPVRGAQFTQIEHRVGTVVDLMIASHLPLIRTSDESARAERRAAGGSVDRSHEASGR